MTLLKQFQLYHSWIDDISCVIEVDFGREGIFNEMKEYYEFYHELDDHTPEAITQTFLKHIASAVWFVSANGKLNTEGVRRTVSEMEGYPKLDGSDGFRLMMHEHQEVADEDFKIKEVSGYEYFTPEGL